jgi:hypothetical protein
MSFGSSNVKLSGSCNQTSSTLPDFSLPTKNNNSKNFFFSAAAPVTKNNKPPTNSIPNPSETKIQQRDFLQAFLAAIQEDNIQDPCQLEFLDSLKEDVFKMQAYLIAREHLGTSFDMLRTNIYQDFLKKKGI